MHAYASDFGHLNWIICDKYVPWSMTQTLRKLPIDLRFGLLPINLLLPTSPVQTVDVDCLRGKWRTSKAQLSGCPSFITEVPPMGRTTIKCNRCTNIYSIYTSNTNRWFKITQGLSGNYIILIVRLFTIEKILTLMGMLKLALMTSKHSLGMHSEE